MKIIPTAVPGFGCIYRPSYKDRHGEQKHSEIWWMKYSTDDGYVRRNLKTRDQQAAYEQLIATAGKRITGQIRDMKPETVTLGELLDLLLEHYRTKRTFIDVECRVRLHLRPKFGALRLREFRRAHLDSFVRALEADGLKPSSVNRYLSNLHKALELGRDHELVNAVPKFPWQDEKENIRQGFFEPDTYRTMRDELGITAPHAQLALVLAFHTGMRRGEILKLRWEQVDFKAGVIRLDSKQTKGKRARVAPIYGEMGGFLQMAWSARQEDHSGCPWLIAFNGEPVRSIKTTWKRASEKLRIDGALFHDLRRTALSNMEEAGIPHSTAMSISGHRTESAYKRYLIGSERRAVAAGQMMETFWQSREAQQEPAQKSLKQ